MVFPARYREGGYFTSLAKSWPIPTKAFRKNLDSGYFAAERLGVENLMRIMKRTSVLACTAEIPVTFGDDE
jgi:hypothetical protein